MRHHNVLFRSTLLLTIVSIIFYSPLTASPEQEAPGKIEQTPFAPDQPLTYDAILTLIDEIEAGELEEKCTQADLERINCILANLAREGILPNEVGQEYLLEQDIQELLEDEPLYSFSFDQGEAPIIVPAVWRGQSDLVLCKSWSKKSWDKTKKFVKKHKKAIIIGAVVVVVVVVIVATGGAGAAAASNAGNVAAVGAGAAGAAAASTSEEKKSETKEKRIPVSSAAAMEDPIIRENIVAFKETVSRDSSMQAPLNDSNERSFRETIRVQGARAAHGVLNGAAELVSPFPRLLEEGEEIARKINPDFKGVPVFNFTGDPANKSEIASPVQTFERIVAAGHEKIDQAFGVDQAGSYTPEAKAQRAAADQALGRVNAFLPFPGGFSRPVNLAKAREIIKSGQGTPVLAEELGFSRRAITRLEKTGTLDKTVANTFENIVSDQAKLASFEKFKSAEAFLEPYSKGFVPEAQARELIRQTGVRAFPRPVGIPEDFVVRVTDRGAGIEYMHPTNTHISVRVMPGKPHSPNPSQQKPYVIHKKDGKAFDKLGNMVGQKEPEAHIPVEEFIYRGD